MPSFSWSPGIGFTLLQDIFSLLHGDIKLEQACQFRLTHPCSDLCLNWLESLDLESLLIGGNYSLQYWASQSMVIVYSSIYYVFLVFLSIIYFSVFIFYICLLDLLLGVWCFDAVINFKCIFEIYFLPPVCRSSVGDSFKYCFAHSRTTPFLSLIMFLCSCVSLNFSVYSIFSVLQIGR